MLVISKYPHDASLAARARVAGDVVFKESDDAAALQRLYAEAAAVQPPEGAAPHAAAPCCLLLQSAALVHHIQTHGLPEQVTRAFDVVALTPYDLLAMQLLVPLQGATWTCTPLDREPISRDSETTVHLVLLGFGHMAQALALHAALVAHYPNYCRDSRLRTRITVIGDDVAAERDAFVQRYEPLFEHAWHRTLHLHDAQPTLTLHKPCYEGQRKDFVDVEWEFVHANLQHDVVRRKLGEWARSPRQLLTLALCSDQTALNTEAAWALPREVWEHRIPVLCYTHDSTLPQLAIDNGACPTLRPFGLPDCNPAVLPPLLRMAQCVNYVYDHCFSLPQDAPITAPAIIDTARLQPLWHALQSVTKQYSNLYHAMTLQSKLHSVGHDTAGADDYLALSADEIAVLTEVEHNRWSVEELILGYRPPTDEEMARVEADITLKRALRKQMVHYDLRAFDDLRRDATGKNVQVYDQALVQGMPLILRTCTTN